MNSFFSKYRIFSLQLFTAFYLLFFSNFVIGAQNFFELHSGNVKLIRDGKSQNFQKLDEKFPLLKNDMLQTGGNTNVSLYLKDKDNVIKLFSNSFFKLEEVSLESNGVSLLTGKGNFNVKPIDGSNEKETDKDDGGENKIEIGGKFKKLTKSKIPRRKKRFMVRTVSAIVGVRGTEFVVATTDDATKILGVEGEVTLASPEIPDYEVPVQENQASQVKEGSGPSVPVSVPPSESEKIVSGEGAKTFQEVEFGPSELISTIQDRLQSDDETPRFEEEKDNEGRFLEQLDRLEELESIVDNAENAISSSKQKILILSMTFTNR